MGIFACGVEVIQQNTNAYPTAGCLAQCIKQPLGGVIGMDGVVLQIQCFLRRLDECHAAAKSQLGTAHQCKARVVVGASCGGPSRYRLAEAGVGVIRQRI